uniref:Legume lectin domain-containing protein n=1 Tax=Solanum lycopersicum TaxID=4081 RepID=A0A3Q7IF49_SOLLC
LTKNSLEFIKGGATYSKTIYLWDKGSAIGRNLYANGLTFFLAPVGSVIHDKHFVVGEGLGLACVDQQYLSKNHHFVAVKFYIFTNYYDPHSDHVGININSMQSVANVTSFSGSHNGTRIDASITYN